MNERADRKHRPQRPGRTARELRILFAVADALNSAADERQAVEQGLALAAELLGLRSGWVWLLDPESGRFYNAAALNLPPYLREPVRMTGEPCWCLGRFLRGDMPASNVPLIQCSRLDPAVQARDEVASGGLCCHASIPLTARGRGLGLLNVAAPAFRELDAAELRLLTTIGQQVGAAVERARLSAASARLERAEERARLARELHDTLAQGLTAIALHLESGLAHLEADPAGARARLERALAATRDNLADARRSVLELRGTSLAGRPLGEALDALSRAFTSETGIRVAGRRDPPPTLAPSAEAELYRIAQEALTNVRRHAAATAVRLDLVRRPGAVRLTVRDNGAGFDPRIATAGVGLVGMRERARLLGGRLRLHSRPGKGTVVTVDIPGGDGGSPP
jgi:two-component system NarL family sensor kinase